MAKKMKMQGPGGGRSANQRSMTGIAGIEQKGKAVAPTQGMTRNQPNTSTATGKRLPAEKAATTSTYFANSRSPVHKNFDRHPHD